MFPTAKLTRPKASVKSKAQNSADIRAANHALLGTSQPSTHRTTRANNASAIAATNRELLHSLYRTPTPSFVCPTKTGPTKESAMHQDLNPCTSSEVSTKGEEFTTLEELFGYLPNFCPANGTKVSLSADQLSPSCSASNGSFDDKRPTTLHSLFGGLSLTQVLSNVVPTVSAKKSESAGQPPIAVNSALKIYDAGRFYDIDVSNISHDVLLSMFGAVVQTLFHGASQKAAGTSLLISNWSRKTSGQNTSDTRSLRDNKDQILDVRTAMKMFNLEPEVTTYACCPVPSCCAIFPPELDYTSSILKFPLTCTHTRFNKVCGSSLVGKSKVLYGMSVPQPIKPYVYHHFHDHVAGMLSRPGIEQAIGLHMASSVFKDEITDITSSLVLQGFVDSEGKSFLREAGTDIRLVWALCVDWYNPNKNKAAGKSVSTGVIAMICLSLPPDLRTLEENIYLAGVIPGPHEPSLDAVNHFLLPLINDLVAAYNPGVYFTRTHEYPSGRKSNSAIIPVICDTMASKKVTGNCGHGGRYFCSRCRLPRNEIDNLEVSSWPPGLSREEHSELANAWQNATNAANQKSRVKSHGIRWSALLLLPYWQPSQWTITEGMHIVLLGIVPRHCRDLLELNINDLPHAEDEEEMPSDEAMVHGRKVLVGGIYQRLRALKMNVLKALCKEYNVRLRPATRKKGRRTKAEYAEALLGGSSSSALECVETVELASLFDNSVEVAKVPPPSLQSAPVSVPVDHEQDLDSLPCITKDDLQTIQRQIRETIRPYWQALLPENFGTPEHGKLKADQWRTAIEFDIPVSLIQLLAHSKHLPGHPNHTRLRKIVGHTLDLAIAVSWGFSRRTSRHHAERYAFFMHRYLCGIQELFPDYDLKPNHHYALHIPDLLLLFGPLHGTWAFSLERLIGRLQNLHTNGKTGEMEVTVMRSFCRRANIRRFVSLEQCPIVLKEAWTDLEKHLNLRDLNDIPSQDRPNNKYTKASELDPDILESLQAFLLKSRISEPDTALLSGKNTRKFHRLHIKGIQYTNFHTSLPHSLIYFSQTTTSDSTFHGVPCQIREIFEHYRMCGTKVEAEIFIAIHRFRKSRLSPSEDYFSFFPEFRAAIYDNDPVTEVEIIRPSQVKCHANRRPWDSSSFVMRAVDRVSLVRNLPCSRLSMARNTELLARGSNPT